MGPRRTSTWAVPAVLLTGLLGCGDDVGSSDPIALDGVEVELDAPDVADAPADGPPEATAPFGEVVDASVAEPGTWQLGEAGSVTFDVVGGELVLAGVAATDGWQITEQDADEDDIEVELARASERYLFEVELDDDGTRLEVRIEHDLERVPGGTYALGDAGAVEVRVDGERLVVERVTVAEGWQVVAEEREDDELEVELVRGDQRWHLEVEVDDDHLDVEIVYEVRGEL
jgi:hypothetical protein